ncbi:hypothetical protein Tco_1448024 [Tanacetum coccineum]
MRYLSHHSDPDIKSNYSRLQLQQKWLSQQVHEKRVDVSATRGIRDPCERREVFVASLHQNSMWSKTLDDELVGSLGFGGEVMTPTSLKGDDEFVVLTSAASIVPIFIKFGFEMMGLVCGGGGGRYEIDEDGSEKVKVPIEEKGGFEFVVWGIVGRASGRVGGVGLWEERGLGCGKVACGGLGRGGCVDVVAEGWESRGVVGRGSVVREGGEFERAVVDVGRWRWGAWSGGGVGVRVGLGGGSEVGWGCWVAVGGVVEMGGGGRVVVGGWGGHVGAGGGGGMGVRGECGVIGWVGRERFDGSVVAWGAWGGGGDELLQGELVQGELVQGELIQGELVQGELVQGELIQGELVQGELVQGELIQGELVQGELVQGELVQGELVQGELVQGELIQGELVQGELVQGELV